MNFYYRNELIDNNNVAVFMLLMFVIIIAITILFIYKELKRKENKDEKSN